MAPRLTWILAMVAFGAAYVPASTERASPVGVRFTDVAPASGLVYPTWSGSPRKTHIRETLGQGACWFDFDRDGDADLLVLNGARDMRLSYSAADPLLEPWRLYENRGGRFVEVSARAGLDLRVWGIGCAAADVDADGFDDLFVTTAASPDLLLRNRGDGTFERVPFADGLDGPYLSAGAAFGDLDRDGDLDLFVARYLDESHPPAGGCRWKGMPVMCGPKGYPALDARLFLNRGDGRFAEAGAKAGVAGHAGFGLGVVLFDADDDRDIDVYVANDSSPSHLFVNAGDGTFREAGFMAGVALSANGGTQAGMGVDVGDVDGDGRMDVIKTNFSDDVNNLYHNDGRGMFVDWTFRSGLAGPSVDKLGWAVLMEDFDLDGDLDVVVVNGHVYPEVDRFPSNTAYRQPLQLFLNDGAGRFVDQGARAGEIFTRAIAGRSAAAVDFDGDGDLDVLVTRDGEPPLLLRNDLVHGSAHWLAVRLRGAGRNREGIGARIEVETLRGRQVREVRRSRGYLSSGMATTIVGLGPEPRATRVTVRWPDGRVQTLTDVAADRALTIEEPLGRHVRP